MRFIPSGHAAQAHTALTNPGIVRLGRESSDLNTPRTIILAGRSEALTRMLATLLKRAGIHDPAQHADLEDQVITRVCVARDTAGLVDAIRKRNRARPIWACQLPGLCDHLQPHDMARFRNPHLVVALCQEPEIAPERAIARDLAELEPFLAACDCPVLAVNDDVATRHPAAVIHTLADFVRIPLSPRQCDDLASLMQAPGQLPTPTFQGHLDGIFGNHLIGWCRALAETRAVSVDLLVNGVSKRTRQANVPRDDLRRAGIGSGRYGFDIDLTSVTRDAGALLAVRVSGQPYEVPISGLPMWRYMR